MNEQEQLKLQSHLDGELSAAEHQEVLRWLDSNEEARALLKELQTTKRVVRENEPELKLDCSREFYWNAIAREIEREEPVVVESRNDGLFGFLRHYGAQLTGVAAGIAVIAFSFTAMTNEPEVDSAWEVLDPGTAMVSYNDFDSGITVVMLYDQTTAGFTVAE